MRQTDERAKIVRRTLADGTTKEYRYRRENKNLRGLAPTGTSCWDLLAIRFEKSTEWANLAIRTRSEYRRTFGLAAAYWPSMTMDDLSDRRVRADFYEFRDSFARTPVMADKHLRHVCSLLEWAYDRGLVDVNHARRMKPLSLDRMPRADIVIALDQRKALFDACDDAFRDLMIGALLTGLRQADLCALSWEQMDADDTLIVQPSKTRRKRPHLRVWLPVNALPSLASLISRRRIATVGHGRIFTRPNGKIWSHASIDYRWQRLKREVLGDVDLHWHDWRGTLVSMLTAAGCSNPQIGSITGHAVGLDEGGNTTALSAYQARTKTLAATAYLTLARYLGEQSEMPEALRLRVV